MSRAEWGQEEQEKKVVEEEARDLVTDSIKGKGDYSLASVF